MRNRPSVTWNNFHITYGKWPSNKKKVFIYVETLHRLSQLIPQYMYTHTYCIHILHVLAFNHHNIPLTIPKERHKVEIRKEKPEYKSIQSVPVIILLLVIQKIFFSFWFLLQNFVLLFKWKTRRKKNNHPIHRFWGSVPIQFYLGYIKTTVPHLFDVLYFIVRRKICVFDCIHSRYNIRTKKKFVLSKSSWTWINSFYFGIERNLLLYILPYKDQLLRGKKKTF